MNAGVAKLLGVLALLAAFFFGGMHVQARLDDVETLQSQLASAHLINQGLSESIGERDAARAKDAEIARTTGENYEKALSDLAAFRAADNARRRAGGGLRIPAPACPAAGPATGAEAAGADQPDEGAARTVPLPQEVEQGLYDIVDEADDLTEQLRLLQAWARKSGFYGPEPQ